MGCVSARILFEGNISCLLANWSSIISQQKKNNKKIEIYRLSKWKECPFKRVGMPFTVSRQTVIFATVRVKLVKILPSFVKIY